MALATCTFFDNPGKIKRAIIQIIFTTITLLAILLPAHLQAVVIQDLQIKAGLFGAKQLAQAIGQAAIQSFAPPGEKSFKFA
ncbi:MAG: hypothetical protein R3E89_01185 [Thiolinea sp.]